MNATPALKSSSWICSRIVGIVIDMVIDSMVAVGFSRRQRRLLSVTDTKSPWVARPESSKGVSFRHARRRLRACHPSANLELTVRSDEVRVWAMTRLVLILAQLVAPLF